MHDRENRIKYISQPASVQMADKWYALATEEHFWMQRRWDVAKRCFGDIIGKAERIGEIGCGNAVVIRQMEKDYGKRVDGFDLNDAALKSASVLQSDLYCYDILEKSRMFSGMYDLIILFDVIEHINTKDQAGFFDAALYMMKQEGTLLVNVPALRALYSDYDVMAGHQKRYHMSCLRKLAEENGLRICDWTYWGMPLVPLLVARKFYLKFFKASDRIERGFRPPHKWMNTLCWLSSRMEMWPQHVGGASLMAAFKKRMS